MKATISTVITFLTGSLYIFLFRVREINLINLFQTKENMIFTGVVLLLLGLLVFVDLAKNSDKNLGAGLYKVILKGIFINLSVFLSFELIFGIFSD